MSEDFEHEIAPPAAPYEMPSQQETGSNWTEGFSENAEQIFLLLSNPETYQHYYQYIQKEAHALLGDENYAVVSLYAVPITIVFFWTLFVYWIGYYRGRKSNHSVLVNKH